MTQNAFRAPLPEELAPLFPSYRILSLIATGGMGAVYRAVQTSLEREVAIKILPVESSNDPEFCAAFAAEAKAMAKLNHPNLIGVYDFGEVNGMLYIVMEYVPGQSLHDACNGSAVEPAEVVRLMTGISLGLAHAHQHGILHRDIKPANILLDAHLQPKIGDFGLARPMDAQVDVGETIYGTPGYTAPEVVQPPHTVDQRADIFSLGILLHELLTGLLPSADPRSPSAISQCDPRFDAVVQKATHPDPRQRYQSAQEIADAMEKIGSSAGPRVLRTTSPAAAARRKPTALGKPVTTFQPAESSNRGKVVLLFLLLAVLGLLVKVFPWHRVSENPAPSSPPSHVVEKTPEPKPEPVPPEPVVPDPEPVSPEPGTVVVDPEPPAPGPEPVVSNPEPEPGPTDPGTQPKFDVAGFLTHARSVMLKRCEPEIARHKAALEKNLLDFHSAGLALKDANLESIHHSAFEREFGAFIEERKNNGNRVGDELVNKLKFKQWLVEAQDDYRQKEAAIDGDLKNALAEQQKTYLYGLGLKVKTLTQENDVAAAVLIQAEIDKVNADPDYFPALMQETVER